ncbi:MAG TPA: hypothetical protein VM490_09455 [Armatimonadaceae bacterium]|nr:hypothetical protein [Armatimonadaceae bacterium]
MAKADRDWAQLDAFEAEYGDRLKDEKRSRGGSGNSHYLNFLQLLADGVETFYADEVKGRDDATRRLFALRGKIFSLREKVGASLPEDEGPLLPVEREYVRKGAIPKKREKRRVKLLADPAPPGYAYPVTFEDIRAVLAELPEEHVATVREIRLSHQRRTGADADWLEGEIRLHCLAEVIANAKGEPVAYRRAMMRAEGGQDVERFGGEFEWIDGKLYARWPAAEYRTFVLRRVLIHEVAHGVAELPGYAEKVRSVGSLERFCEQYAENFYRPPGKSVRLGF